MQKDCRCTINECGSLSHVAVSPAEESRVRCGAAKGPTNNGLKNAK